MAWLQPQKLMGRRPEEPSSSASRTRPPGLLSSSHWWVTNPNRSQFPSPQGSLVSCPTGRAEPAAPSPGDGGRYSPSPGKSMFSPGENMRSAPSDNNKKPPPCPKHDHFPAGLLPARGGLRHPAPAEQAGVNAEAPTAGRMSRAAIKLLVTPQLHQSDKGHWLCPHHWFLKRPRLHREFICEATHDSRAAWAFWKAELRAALLDAFQYRVVWVSFFFLLEGKDFISLHSFKLVICICQAKD